MVGRPLLLLGLVLLVGLAVGCAQGAAPSPLAFLVQMDPAQGQLPEGIAVGKDALYVGMAPSSQVFRVTRDGKVTPFAQLPQIPPGQGFMVGMALDERENLYVALASFTPQVQTGIYRVPPAGGQAVLFATDKGMALPNVLAFDKKGALFVSDSFAAAVFKVTPDGKVSKWVEHPLLKGNRIFCPPAQVDFDVGANGIAFNDKGDLFVANTHGATLVRVPVKRDGSAGTPEVFAGPDCANLKGADGIAIDRRGDIYVTANFVNKLVKVGRDKKVTVLESGGLMDFPASIAFGVGKDSKTLYVTNFGLLTAQGGGKPKVGVLKKEIGVRGRPLP